jgi:single-strand DNA-binding protein
VAETLTRGSRVLVVGRLRQRSWETPEGDKRSTVEIEADEVGPSLRWATAKVEKVQRSGGGDWSQGVKVGAGGGSEETPLETGGGAS